MAFLAECFLMLVLKGIFGVLVVVESERFPILFGMTSLALIAVISFMAFLLVIFAVATNASHLQFFAGRRTGYTFLVASLTLGIAVLALKGVLGILVVIEIGRFPALVIVATLAFFAQASPVAFLLVVLAMARHTGHRQFLFIQVPLAG